MSAYESFEVHKTEQGPLQEDARADQNHQYLLRPFHLEGRSRIFSTLQNLAIVTPALFTPRKPSGGQCTLHVCFLNWFVPIQLMCEGFAFRVLTIRIINTTLYSIAETSLVTGGKKPLPFCYKGSKWESGSVSSHSVNALTCRSLLCNTDTAIINYGLKCPLNIEKNPRHMQRPLMLADAIKLCRTLSFSY